MIPDTLSATEARKLLFHLLENVERSNHHYTVTKGGVPIAKVISVEEWDGLVATLEILAHPGHRRQLDRRLATGKGAFVSHNDLFGHPTAHRR